MGLGEREGLYCRFFENIRNGDISGGIRELDGKSLEPGDICFLFEWLKSDDPNILRAVVRVGFIILLYSDYTDALVDCWRDGGHSMFMLHSTETLRKRLRVHNIPTSVKYWGSKNPSSQKSALKVLSGLSDEAVIKCWLEDKSGNLKRAVKTYIRIDGYDKKVLLDECER